MCIRCAEARQARLRFIADSSARDARYEAGDTYNTRTLVGQIFFSEGVEQDPSMDVSSGQRGDKTALTLGSASPFLRGAWERGHPVSFPRSAWERIPGRSASHGLASGAMRQGLTGNAPPLAKDKRLFIIDIFAEESLGCRTQAVFPHLGRSS